MHHFILCEGSNSASSAGQCLGNILGILPLESYEVCPWSFCGFPSGALETSQEGVRVCVCVCAFFLKGTSQNGGVLLVFLKPSTQKRYSQKDTPTCRTPSAWLLSNRLTGGFKKRTSVESLADAFSQLDASCFHLLKNMFSFRLLVLKGSTTTGHVHLFSRGLQQMAACFMLIIRFPFLPLSQSTLVESFP